MMGDAVLKIEKLCKSFGPTKANINIDFELRRGEVRGLAGENGSGKSTLLSQIAGMIPYDSGTMTLLGEAYEPHSPREANIRRVSMVVQELGVVHALPAGVNVFLGRMEPFTKCMIVNTKKMYAEIARVADEWGLIVPPLNQLGGNMHVEERKVIELLRALSVDPEILILDEVTQALSHDNRIRLNQIIKRFKEMGRSVILITHDLEEMLTLTDSITVLRDGEVVNTVESASITEDQLKRMMVGRNLTGEYYRNDQKPSRNDEVVLEVSDLNVGEDVKDLSFSVYSGEILGFCGLSDSGIHTVGKAVYGLIPERTGSVVLKQKNIPLSNSMVSLHNKVAYVPKERDGEGLMMQASICENFCLPSLDELKSKGGFLSPAVLHSAANDAKERFHVRCQDIFQRISHLSGGNKQKINLGRWLAKDLDLMILDCPTRGVDVSVKAYIYQLLKEAKASGKAIILISDELSEVLGMADRILVMKNGEMIREIARGPEFSEDAIIEVMI